MPRIPTYDNFQTAATASPFVAANAPSGPTAGSIRAEQSQQMSRAASQAGDVAARIATDAQEQVNQVRAIHAADQLLASSQAYKYDTTSGFLQLKGDQAFKSDTTTGKAPEQAYADKLQRDSADIAQSLDNPMQRRVFELQAKNIHRQFSADLQQHVLGEYKNFQRSTFAGAAQLAVDSAERDWQNPNAINGSTTINGVRTPGYVDRLGAAIRESGQLQGMAPSQIQALIDTKVSDVHTKVIRAALTNNNPTYAVGYLQQHKGSMTGADVLQVDALVNHTVDVQAAQGAVTKATQAHISQVNPTDLDRLTGIVMGMESGGRELDAKGGVLTSSAGAKGSMQVMDATNKNPGLGVKPAQDDSPGERARVGRDYLAALVKRYGRADLALAAYNAGFGNVDKALADSARDAKNGAYRGAGGQPASDWLDKLAAYQSPDNHKQTVAYVQKGVQKFQLGQGATPMPTELQFIQTAVDGLGANPRPQQLQMVRDAAKQQYTVLTNSRKELGDQAVELAQQAIVQVKGDMTKLPADVMLKVTQLAPGRLDDLNTYAGKIARGAPMETDWPLYYSLSTDPQLLKNTNLVVMRSKLGDAEFKHLTERQTKLNDPQGDEFTHLQSARDVLNTFMKQAGINPAPKYDDADGTAKVGTLLSQFQTRVEARERLLGKKLDTPQLNEEAAQLFKPTEIARSMWFNGTKPAGLVGTTDRVAVPDADRAQITASLKKAGRPATDQAIEALYRAHNRIPQRTAQN